jgi:ATP-dependent Clp protease ATP-binding subunit ClpC
VNLSVRYVADRALPDKAIDLIDEAGSRVRLRDRIGAAGDQGGAEEPGEVTRQKDEAIAGQDYEAAARLRDEEAQGKERIEELRATWHEEAAKDVPVVTDEDIAEVVSMWTGIPVVRISTEESERLLKMEEALHKRIIGQQEAIDIVSKAVRRARAGLKDPEAADRLLHLHGPHRRRQDRAGPGAGRVHVRQRRRPAEDRHERVHGAPQRLAAGRRPAGLRRLRRGRPADRGRAAQVVLVVLLDEIEKAHPEVFNILLQILEDGHLTDAKGAGSTSATRSSS